MVEEPVARAREQVLVTLRTRLSGIDLEGRAGRLGAAFDPASGELVLEMLGRQIRVDAALKVRSPEGPIDYEEEVILLNALLPPGAAAVAGATAEPARAGSGRSPSGSWVPFREMGGGHAADFHAEVEVPLAQEAERVVDKAERVAASLGATIAEPLAGSDLTLEVRLFPGIDALVQVFLPDMEFPADARILFSAGAAGVLPPGCLEELGHRLVDRILAAAGAPHRH
jgi:hypothetical protein